MTTSSNRVANLSEQELLDYFAELVVRDRRTTADLLVAIAEVDERKLWATHACSSMFTFCMERFHMSEQVTAKRLWAARTARRFPVILDLVARGELHLSAIHLLAKHLTDENHAAVLERAKHKSYRELERLVAELAPRADVPSRIRALPTTREGSRAMARPTTVATNARAPQAMATSSAVAMTTSSAVAMTTSSAVAMTTSSAAAMTTSSAAAMTMSSAAAMTMSSAAATIRDSRENASIETPGSTDRVSMNRIEATDHEPAGSLARPGLVLVKKPIVALSPRRYKIEITVDEATHDKLRSLQDLLARTETGRDPAEIISRAIDVLLNRTLTRKAGVTDRATPAPDNRPNSSVEESSVRVSSPAPATSVRKKPARDSWPTHVSSAFDVVAARSRAIPAAVRREVWQRDSGRCRYENVGGHRCRETGNIEFHHKIPFAVGGPSTAENIELRCAAHNQLQADLDFGRSFMDARRGGR